MTIVCGRAIGQRGKFGPPGTFRTRVITTGTCPCLYLYDKKTHAGQYLKEGRALRTKTTINQPRDLGTGKELTNLAALATAGDTASRRLAGAGSAPTRSSNASRTAAPARSPPTACPPPRSSPG